MRNKITTILIALGIVVFQVFIQSNRPSVIARQASVNPPTHYLAADVRANPTTIQHHHHDASSLASFLKDIKDWWQQRFSDLVVAIAK